MPIDPSIPLSVKSPQFDSPLELYSAVAQLQAQREQGELRRMAADEARQRGLDANAERADQRKLSELYADAVTVDPVNGQIKYNRDTLLAKARVEAPHLVPTLLDQLEKDEVRMNTLIKSGLDLDHARRVWLAEEAPDVIDAQGDPEVWKTTLLRARQTNSIDQATYDREVTLADPAQILARAQNWVKRATKPGESFTLNPGDVRYDATGKVIARGEAKPVEHSPAWKEWQDYLSTGGTLTFDQYQDREANRHKAVVRVNTGQATDDDLDAMLDGIEEGTLPPQLPGRASPLYTKLMARAQRRGINLASRATDWIATTRTLTTMNGAQQVRLRQAIGALPAMLDKVDTLATRWNAGRFPLLNRAHLAAAKGGAYGTEAAKIANELDAQIADVVADLGNVYMGGNSPTDHALSLAQKSLSADWSEPVLRQMVKLAKANVQIRLNSIANTGVAGASADNPYAPQAPAVAPPTGRFNPATGKVER